MSDDSTIKLDFTGDSNKIDWNIGYQGSTDDSDINFDVTGSSNQFDLDQGYGLSAERLNADLVLIGRPNIFDVDWESDDLTWNFDVTGSSNNINTLQNDGEQTLNFTLDGDSNDVDINQISGSCVSGAGNSCATPNANITLDITSDNAVIQINQKIRQTILSLLLFSGVSYADSIGDIVESTGVGQIVRNNEATQQFVGYGIELYDVAETVNGRMKIEFLDAEELDLIEHTEVYIDEVYYDPNPSLSKMSLRMVQGITRFASGKGNKIKKANIDISTPTQIAINGTDFTTTIDELGRTLVILLPDEDGVTPSGEIVVSNEGGSITLNQAYQATMVSTRETPPTNSVVINNLTTSMIDNMFIVSPLKRFRIPQ